MIGSSGPMIASTFWKKTIHGAISCDQPTTFDSSSCSRKLPEVWKNFFGMIGARSCTSSSAYRAPAARSAFGVVAALVERPHVGQVERGDLVALDHARKAAAVGRLEGDQLHSLTPQSSLATSAYTCAMSRRPSIARFSPSGSGSPLEVP